MQDLPRGCNKDLGNYVGDSLCLSEEWGGLGGNEESEIKLPRGGTGQGTPLFPLGVQ